MRRTLVAALAALAAGAPYAHAHEGNPNFRSTVRAIAPPGAAISVEVLNYDDRLLLRNESGRTVIVRGYRGEPYVRLLGNGTVEVNRRSPAAHLNEDHFAQVDVPAAADPKAAPDWELVGRNGSFEWHDHRIHWMVEGRRPPQVGDPDAETKVFAWRVPIEVAGEPGAIRGDLRWVPLPGGGYPLAAALSLAAVAVGGAGTVLVVRRRRRPETASKEAW